MRRERYIRLIYWVYANSHVVEGLASDEFNFPCVRVEAKEEISCSLEHGVVIGDTNHVVSFVILPELGVERETPQGQVEGPEYIAHIL